MLCSQRLLIGVVDVDSGDAVVLDMVDMAHKAVDNSDGRAEGDGADG